MSVVEVFDVNIRFWFDLQGWHGGMEFDILLTEVVVVAC